MSKVHTLVCDSTTPSLYTHGLASAASNTDSHFTAAGSSLPVTLHSSMSTSQGSVAESLPLSGCPANPRRLADTCGTLGMEAGEGRSVMTVLVESLDCPSVTVSVNVYGVLDGLQMF